MVFLRPNRLVKAKEGTFVVDLDLRLIGNCISSSGGAVGPNFISHYSGNREEELTHEISRHRSIP